MAFQIVRRLGCIESNFLNLLSRFPEVKRLEELRDPLDTLAAPNGFGVNADHVAPQDRG